MNTAGAAGGSLLVDVSLIPAVGIGATQGIAAFLNLAAGVAALLLANRMQKSETPEADRPADAPAAEPIATEAVDPRTARTAVRAATLVLGLTGAASLALEITWFRFLSSVLGSYRLVFSLLLAVMLISMWAGSMLAGALDRRVHRPWAGLAVSQACLWATGIAGFILYDPALKEVGTLSMSAGVLADVAFVLRPTFIVCALPAICMGFSFPLANAAIQRAADSVGTRAGILYLANTVGAVVGSLAAGFLLLPALGLVRTIAVIGAVQIISGITIVIGSRTVDGPDRKIATVCVALSAVVFAAWMTVPADEIALKAFSPREQEQTFIAIEEGITESVAVTDTGVEGHNRILYTNGHLMSGTSDNARRYMRAMAHVPLLHIDEPETALVICFGVGNTLHAVSLHPTIEQLEVVDLSETVLAQAEHFETWNRGVLDDPRVTVFINDGRQHLRSGSDERYDLVTLEPPPLTFAGVGALYSREFYELARARLAPGGFVTQWLPAYQVEEEVSDAMVRAFVDVFPDTVMISGYGEHLILMGRKDAPIELDMAALDARIAAAPGVAQDLVDIRMGSIVDIVGSYAGGFEVLENAVDDAPALIDDWPISEYRLRIVDRGTSVNPAVFDVRGAARWCPDCFAETSPIRGQLITYLSMMSGLYESETFLRWGRLAPEPGSVQVALPLPPDQLGPFMQAFPYTRAIFPQIAEQVAR